MSAPMSVGNRRVATVALSTFCLVACFLYKGAPTPEQPDARMVFGMTVESPNGDLLASPVVMGEPGQKVQVHLLCEADPRADRMSLTLEPMGVEDGQMLYSYDLSVAGRVKSEHGTVKLTPGKERSISVHPNDPHGVTLSLFAAPLKHPNVARYLLNHKLRRHPAAS